MTQTKQTGPHAPPPERRRGLRWATVWLGCDLAAWLRLVVPNVRRLALSRCDVLLVSLLASLVNSLLGAIQGLIFAWPLCRVRPVRGPLFVVGHWRSGTTVLHELLALDHRHTFPNNYVCFAPHHFLLTEWLLSDGFDWLAPPSRPTDDLPLVSTSPQEDEFSLLNLGAPSPYAALAFPGHGPDLAQRLLAEESDPRLARRWRRKMLWLVRALTFRQHKRLVLKSPTHTFRIRRLLELFPDAQFVHIVREPAATITSTVALWTSLCRTQALGRRDESRLEDSVVDNYLALRRSLDAVRPELRPDQFHEIRYEQLLEDPVGQMKSLYAALGLGQFEWTRPEVIRSLLSVKQHRPAVRPLSPQLQARLEKEGLPSEPA